MVSIKDVRLSNSNLTSKPGTVVLSVGGTSGIGKGTLKLFVKHANAPKVYIVGRSKTKAAPLLEELETLNPKGTFIFLESEVSLIKNVDTICEEIKKNEKKVDLILLSTGFLSFEGRQGTPDIPKSQH
jgi:NADP-dependent 3-hydroxy acid dehydrogenase YdfG